MAAIFYLCPILICFLHIFMRSLLSNFRSCTNSRKNLLSKGHTYLSCRRPSHCPENQKNASIPFSSDVQPKDTTPTVGHTKDILLGTSRLGKRKGKDAREFIQPAS